LSREEPVQITDRERRVYRVVVVPGWIYDDGTVDRDAFKPRPKDNGRLSASDKGCDAATALSTWNQTFPTMRQKVVSVSVQDCTDVGIPVLDDSDTDSLHVHLDFTHWIRFHESAGKHIENPVPHPHPPALARLCFDAADCPSIFLSPDDPAT
jgi:hypothetical protein